MEPDCIQGTASTTIVVYPYTLHTQAGTCCLVQINVCRLSSFLLSSLQSLQVHKFP